MFNKLFLETVQRFHMILPRESVCVGFSGGADSVCLLSLFYENRKTLDISLSAAHVNHCLRGEESDADETFVRAFCDARGIPLTVLRAQIEKERFSGESTELCARRVRYAFFESLSADKIATAHTGSDAAETMLMNLSRGTSLHGLCSIPPQRGNIIRPLISFTRRDTEAYCREHGLIFRTDSTNLTDAYTRNRLRHSVVPELERIFPAFEASAMRCMDNLRMEDDYLAQETDRQFSALYSDAKLSVNGLLLLHPAIRYRVLAKFLSQLPHAAYEACHLQALEQNLENAGFCLTIPGSVHIRNDGSFIYRVQDESNLFADGIKKINRAYSKELFFNGISLRLETAVFNSEINMNCQFIDFYKIDDIIEIRNVFPRDIIRLPKRNCSKTLKKAYMELKISAAVRNRFPVLADSRGLIWAYGIGPDRTRLADKNTTKILIIHTEGDK